MKSFVGDEDEEVKREDGRPSKHMPSLSLKVGTGPDEFAIDDLGDSADEHDNRAQKITNYVSKGPGPTMKNSIMALNYKTNIPSR